MCDCHSYNSEVGNIPETLLGRPSWMPEGKRPNGVPVDACIADVVQYLWDNDIVTEGSCCGHNGKFGSPSLVLGIGEDNYSRIRSLIKEKDNRYFELTQWKRVIV